MYSRGQWRQLTSGAWVVTGLAGVDEDAGRVYFTANRDDVLAGQVYALDLKAPGSIERLTEPGWSSTATMDESGKTLVVTRSSPDHPRQTYIADGAGKRIDGSRRTASTRRMRTDRTWQVTARRRSARFRRRTEHRYTG